MEVTYPVPESVSCSVMNAVCFFFAIIATLAIESLIDAIKYLWTFVFILVVMLITSFGVLLISSHLRRRDANLLIHKSEGIDNAAVQNDSIENTHV